jgi:hypothetical protein
MGPNASPAPVNPPLEFWHEQIPLDRAPVDIAARFNELGKQGWGYVGFFDSAVEPDPQGTSKNARTFIFQRQVT